jgi:hypothetical protein
MHLENGKSIEKKIHQKKTKSMETIKCAIFDSISSSHGACTLNLNDLCISVCVHEFPDYVMYIYPDERQTYFMCHYAHREDLQACADVSAEKRAWKEQAVLQMPRKVNGNLRCFVKVACDYVRDAVERMKLRKELTGRGAYVKIKTFAEAKQEILLNPKPRPAAKVNPPPVCPRHAQVHWEADKKRKTLERIARTKESGVYVWKDSHNLKQPSGHKAPSVLQPGHKDLGLDEASPAPSPGELEHGARADD